MKLENDVSHTDNNHGGKSMGVQEERNVVASREWTQKGRRLSWHWFYFFFLFVGIHKPRLSNNWTLLLVVREEFRCTPWLVVEIEPQGCHWSGTSKDLRRVCVCSLFLYFDPSIVVLFFGGFSVHTFVAHGVANELQRGSVHEGSSLNQRWSPVCRVVVRVGVAHWTKGKALTMNKEG